MNPAGGGESLSRLQSLRYSAYRHCASKCGVKRVDDARCDFDVQFALGWLTQVGDQHAGTREPQGSLHG